MTKHEAIAQIMKKIGPNDLVITSTGYLSRDVFALFDRPGNFYMIGSMGSAYGIGIGLALSTKQKVIVISGDGAALMNVGSLVLGTHLRLKNLFHYVIDDGKYTSTGGQITCSESIDFAQFFQTKHMMVKGDIELTSRITLSPKQIKERFMKRIKSV